MLAVGLSLPVSAQITWTGAGGDGLWNTASNWDSFTVPTSSDNVVIGGTTTVSINSDAEAQRIALGTTAGDNVTLNINSSLAYTDVNGISDWGLTTSTVIVNVNSGGILSGAGSGTASRIDGYSSINVFSGGTLQGIDRIRNSTSINVDGSGVFIPVADNGTIGAFAANDTVSLNATNGGIYRMLADGDGSNVSILWSTSGAGATGDLVNATFVFDIVDGYIPQVGDSWDISSPISLANGNIGDGTNVSTISADGLWEFEYDLSVWNPVSSPNRGQIILTGVTAIPEPTTGAMLLGATALLALRRRRA